MTRAPGAEAWRRSPTTGSSGRRSSARDSWRSVASLRTRRPPPWRRSMRLARAPLSPRRCAARSFRGHSFTFEGAHGVTRLAPPRRARQAALGGVGKLKEPFLRGEHPRCPRCPFERPSARRRFRRLVHHHLTGRRHVLPVRCNVQRDLSGHHQASRSSVPGLLGKADDLPGLMRPGRSPDHVWPHACRPQRILYLRCVGPDGLNVCLPGHGLELVPAFQHVGG